VLAPPAVDGPPLPDPGPAVAGATGGTITTDGVWAHLVGSRHLAAQVQALLDRVAQVTHA